MLFGGSLLLHGRIHPFLLPTCSRLKPTRLNSTTSPPSSTTAEALTLRGCIQVAVRGTWTTSLTPSRFLIQGLHTMQHPPLSAGGPPLRERRSKLGTASLIATVTTCDTHSLPSLLCCILAHGGKLTPPVFHYLWGGSRTHRHTD